MFAAGAAGTARGHGRSEAARAQEVRREHVRAAQLRREAAYSPRTEGRSRTICATLTKRRFCLWVLPQRSAPPINTRVIFFGASSHTLSGMSGPMSAPNITDEQLAQLPPEQRAQVEHMRRAATLPPAAGHLAPFRVGPHHVPLCAWLGLYLSFLLPLVPFTSRSFYLSFLFLWVAAAAPRLLPLGRRGL